MKKFFEVTSIVVTVLAVIATSTACVLWFYQPKVPKSLQK